MFTDFIQPRIPSLDFKLISFDIEDQFDSIKSLAKDINNVDQLVKNLHVLRCPDKQRAHIHPEQVPNPVFPAHPMGFNTHAHQMHMPTMKPWGEPLSQTGTPMLSPGSEGSATPPEELARDFNGSYYQNGEQMIYIHSFQNMILQHFRDLICNLHIALAYLL